jgi:hypothetical protein
MPLSTFQQSTYKDIFICQVPIGHSIWSHLCLVYLAPFDGEASGMLIVETTDLTACPVALGEPPTAGF